MDSDIKSRVLIDRTTIQQRIQELAKQVAQDYQGKQVILLCVMRGSFIFMADLLRALWEAGLTDCEPDFISIASYGAETESSRAPVIKKEMELDCRGRHVLVVEDIVDTGHTLKVLLDVLKERHPASLKVVALLSKPARREVEVPIDYLGFEIENKWVMGYGFDIDNKGRGRPDIEEKVG